MLFPDYRPRRMRRNENLRRMIRETRLSTDNLILPVFAVEGKDVQKPIPSLPGHSHFSVDRLVPYVKEAKDAGLPAVIVFGLPAGKDPLGTNAYNKNGIVQRAIKEIKNQVPGMVVITDVCLCQYTDHGHCGMLEKGEIDNDATLDLIARTALSHAKAGADIVAPSDMMDGRVAAIREMLDENEMPNTAIMAYSAKYCSAFFGPFREAADSAPKTGDRSSYQMDPANVVEAVREATMDVEEGADIIMIKPALPYLDVISTVKNEIDLPIAAYSVSGEYAMLKACAQNGWLDYDKAMLEALLGIKRAGADMIITYAALEAAKLLNK